MGLLACRMSRSPRDSVRMRIDLAGRALQRLRVQFDHIVNAPESAVDQDARLDAPRCWRCGRRLLGLAHDQVALFW